ncbi:MAG: LysE family translocator [Hyphomicrobiales bacterium]
MSIKLFLSRLLMEFFDFLPTLPVFASFAVAVFVLAVTPGPDMVFFLGKALSQSRAAGFAAMFGALFGILVHTVMVAVGLSALLATSQTAFTLLKVLGALYLAWLAIDALRSGAAFTVDDKKGKAQSLKAVFMKALGINLLNPKIIVFFVTFLPQFISAGDESAFSKLLFFGVMFTVISVPILGPMIFYADKIAVLLKQSPKVARIIDYVFACALGGLAMKLLLTQGR